MTYETAWSGTLERQRLCPSISGYLGGSTTGTASAGRAKSHHAVVVEGEPPHLRGVRDRLRRGFTLAATAKFYGVSVGVVRRVARRGKITGA